MEKELQVLSCKVADLLKSDNQTIAIAESSAGGLISAYLLSVPGASTYYIGGGGIYTRSAQKGLLGVSDGEMEGLRSSTESYCLLNARKVKDVLGTTWGLAETGAAGPTGNRYGDSAGHSCIGVSGPKEKVITLETGRSKRFENMKAFSEASLNLLIDCIESSRIP